MTRAEDELNRLWWSSPWPNINTDSTTDAFKAGYGAGQSDAWQWIDCKKEMPPEAEDDYWITDGVNVDSVWFIHSGNKWRFVGNRFTPTHWMPMPTLPTPHKAEKEGK